VINCNHVATHEDKVHDKQVCGNHIMMRLVDYPAEQDLYPELKTERIRIDTTHSSMSKWASLLTEVDRISIDPRFEQNRTVYIAAQLIPPTGSVPAQASDSAHEGAAARHVSFAKDEEVSAHEGADVPQPKQGAPDKPFNVKQLRKMGRHKLRDTIVSMIGENGLVFDQITNTATAASAGEPAAAAVEDIDIEPSLLKCSPMFDIDGNKWTEVGHKGGFQALKVELDIPDIATGQEPYNRPISSQIPSEWDRLGHFFLDPSDKIEKDVLELPHHCHVLIATDLPENYISTRFGYAYPNFTTNWDELKSHVAVRRAGGGAWGTKQIGKLLMKMARHSVNLPRGQYNSHWLKSWALPMGTHAWVDWDAMVEKMRSRRGFEEVTPDLLLSIIYNERHSADARRQNKKERFQLLAYHCSARQIEDPDKWTRHPDQECRRSFIRIVAYRILQGWDDEMLLNLEDVHVKVPDDMFHKIAGCFHATRMTVLQDIFKTDLRPMGRAGCMMSMYKHGDPRSFGQQRWKGVKFDCILCLNAMSMLALARQHDGIFMDIQGTLSAPFNIPMHQALEQIIAKPSISSEYIIFDIRYRDFPIVGTIGAAEAGPDLTEAITSADFGARDTSTEGWSDATFACPSKDCKQTNPNGMLVCLNAQCRRIFVLRDPESGKHFSPIVQDYIKAAAEQTCLALPSSINDNFAAAAIANEIVFGKFKHRKSAVMLIKERMRGNIKYCCKWHNGEIEPRVEGETGTVTVAKQGGVPWVRWMGVHPPWDPNTQDWPAPENCELSEVNRLMAVEMKVLLDDVGFNPALVNSDAIDQAARRVHRQALGREPRPKELNEKQLYKMDQVEPRYLANWEAIMRMGISSGHRDRKAVPKTVTTTATKILTAGTASSPIVAKAKVLASSSKTPPLTKSSGIPPKAMPPPVASADHGASKGKGKGKTQASVDTDASKGKGKSKTKSKTKSTNVTDIPVGGKSKGKSKTKTKGKSAWVNTATAAAASAALNATGGDTYPLDLVVYQAPTAKYDWADIIFYIVIALAIIQIAQIAWTVIKLTRRAIRGSVDTDATADEHKNTHEPKDPVARPAKKTKRPPRYAEFTVVFISQCGTHPKAHRIASCAGFNENVEIIKTSPTLAKALDWCKRCTKPGGPRTAWIPRDYDNDLNDGWGNGIYPNEKKGNQNVPYTDLNWFPGIPGFPSLVEEQQSPTSSATEDPSAHQGARFRQDARSPCNYHSKRQPYVARSTAEAEIMAASFCPSMEEID